MIRISNFSLKFPRFTFSKDNCIDTPLSGLGLDEIDEFDGGRVGRLIPEAESVVPFAFGDDLIFGGKFDRFLSLVGKFFFFFFLEFVEKFLGVGSDLGAGATLDHFFDFFPVSSILHDA